MEEDSRASTPIALRIGGTVVAMWAVATFVSPLYVLLFVFCLVVWLMVITASRRRRLAPVIASKRVRSTGTVVLPVPPEAAAGAVRDAMRLLGMFEGAPNQGHVEATTSTTMWSWGERLTVFLQPSPRGTAVTAHSKPLMPTTIFDYGKGQRNVELLLRKVQELTRQSA